MDTGLAHTYMDFKLTSDRHFAYLTLPAQSPKGGDGGGFPGVGVPLERSVGWLILSSTPLHEYLKRTSTSLDIAILSSALLSFRWTNRARKR